MAIGVPGWPELAACTASIASVRIVLTLNESSAAGGCKAVVASMTVRNLLVDRFYGHDRSQRSGLGATSFSNRTLDLWSGQSLFWRANLDYPARGKPGTTMNELPRR